MNAVADVVDLEQHRKAKATEPKAKTAAKPKAKAQAKPKAKVEKPAAKPKDGDSKKVTILAKECPARKGTSRAKFWAKLSNNMTIGEVRGAGIPARFLKKMKAAGHIKIG
jgi:hypothetical protein